MSAGIVYILVNEAMPGCVKIGITESELINRIKGLDNTSVPLPFECYFAARVENCKKVERLIHDAFDDNRIRASREFFRINPDRVKSALSLVALEVITPMESQLIVTNEDREAISNTRKRGANANFEMIGIQPGSILTFSKDHNRTCKVVDSTKVEIDGTVMSVSASALKVLRELDYDWQTVNGWAYWCYQGKTLTEHFSFITE